MLDRDLLDRIADAKEVVIETHSGDRSYRTIIWVAVVDGSIYVRSVRGEAGRWYQRARVEPSVALHIGATAIPLEAIPATDDASVARASRGFEEKYPRGQSLAAMLRPDVLDTTLRLEPPK